MAIGTGMALLAGGSALAGLAGSAMQGNAAKDAARTQAGAANNAAQLQYQASQDAIASQEAAAQQQRQDLSPYAQFGLGVMPQLQQSMQQGQELFGPNAGDQVMNNPMFQALQQQAQTDIMGNQAIRGRLGTGETPQFLQDSALRTGFDVLNQERNANLQQQSMMANLMGMGQSAAAGQGAASMNAAGNIGSIGMNGAAAQGGYMTDAAAASAAGTMGQANAFSNGLNSLMGAGGMLLGGIGQPTVSQNVSAGMNSNFNYGKGSGSGFGFGGQY